MSNKDIIHSFNEKELSVYNYVEAHKKIAGYMTVRELASATSVSTATILRYTKKLGFDSYDEFKYWCKQENHDKIIVGETKEILDCIEKLDSPYYQEQIMQVVDIILSSNLTIFTGIGNSSGIAQYGARLFTNVGIYSLCQDDPFYRISCVRGTPVIIVLTISGETRELIEQISGYHKQGCPILCITTSSQESIAKMADYTISYHLQHRGIETSFDFSSQMPAVYLIEMMAKALSQRINQM